MSQSQQEAYQVICKKEHRKNFINCFAYYPC